MNKQERTQKVQSRALELGFDACGFAKARRLEKEERRLEEWLQQDRHGEMSWMENHFDKRVDPTKLVPGSKSVVSVIASYFDERHKKLMNDRGRPQIAKYAQGRDYHRVFKKKLKKLFQYTKELVGNIEGRVFVDSAPVLDKAWAVEAGLGWLGKNSNVLNKKAGSFFLIGEMITDVEFSYSTKKTDHCGTCTRCIDACPTDAIYEPYQVDATKCISYHTIELKNQIPEAFREDMGEWLFGCDICQDVCPWNSDVIFSKIDDFKPREYLLDKDIDYWKELDIDQYDELFRGSALRRAKFEKFKHNARIVAENLKKKNKDEERNES